MWLSVLQKQPKDFMWDEPMFFTGYDYGLDFSVSIKKKRINIGWL